MCFRIQMIEECGRHLKPNQTNVRIDLIPAMLGNHYGENISPEMLICSTRELAQLTTGIRELSAAFREMVEREPTLPPCCD